MRSCKWNLCLLPALIAGLGLFLAPGAHAQFQWAKRVASTIDTDTELSIGMTLDTNGNCYVTGWFDGTNDFGGVTLTNDSGGGQDIFVAKYNSSGALQWAQRAGGSSTNRDAGRGMGVDPNGNVYAAGGYYGPANFGSINLPASASQNFFLAKYNNTGAVQWVQQGIGGNDVDGTGLAVDGAGNSYALVFANNGDTIMFGSTPVATPNDFDNNYDASTILVKFDNTGAFKWAQVMGGYGETYATKVAVDAAGNVYVRGGFSATLTIGTSNLVVSPGASENVFIAKFNNSGALIWVQVPTGGNGDEGGVAVDSTGNVYISGSFSIPLNFGGITLTNAGSLDAFVAKYNSSGAIQWAQRAGNTNLNFYWDVALDGLGNVYAGGALNSETAVAKYSPVGTLQWIYSAVGLSGNPVGSVAAKCAVDSAGNCFLAGWYQRTNTLGAYVLPPQGYWNYFLTKLAQTLAVATTSLPNGTTGVAYNQQLSAINGQLPYSWTNISGALPPGLALATNGVISGTPTTVITNIFTVQVKDATNGIATQSLSLAVQAPAPLQITATSLPNGTNGVAYSQTLTALGGHPPYTWTNISGALSPGLGLAANGLISGTPTTNGTFNFTVKVTDAMSATATQPLTLTVFGLPRVTLQPTTNSVTATVGGNVIFSVLAAGDGPFSYQWQLNGTNLPNNIITTVAGNGNYGYSGDGSAATNASLGYPPDVAVDSSGNLFIADVNNEVIRKVDTSGIITTVAGDGTNGFAGDGGAATNAELNFPYSVAVDKYDNLFLGDANQRIRKVSANGIITTVAGNGTNGYSGDGGAATNAELFYPSVALDAIGDLFITDAGNNVIREVKTNGIITTVAGNGYGAGIGLGGYSGDGGAATNAELFSPNNTAVDAGGNLFIADTGNQVVREVKTNGIITTVAGNGFGAGTRYGGYSGDGGEATNAELYAPLDVVVDPTGNLFIADAGNNVIREMQTNGIITTAAGNGNPGYSGDGSVATNAELSAPQGVDVDATGDLFIADGNNVIRKVVILGPTLVLNGVGTGNAGAYDVVVSSPYGSVTSSVINLTITLPPILLSTPQLIGGNTNFTFLLSGPAGSNYVLQVSTNLLNWSPVSTSTIPVSGSINLSNAVGGYNRGFYRVHLQ